LFVLDATTRTLEVLLDAAPATNQLPVVVTYADVSFGGATPYLPASSNAVTNGTTAVTAVAAPAASTQRQVEELTVRNDDTAARVVTLRYNDNGTFRKILTPTLQPGETLEYTHAAGLRTLAADGSAKFTWAGPRIAQGGGAVQVNADGSVEVAPAAGKNLTLDSGDLILPAAGRLAWSADLFLQRDGAGLLAQRNGAAQQAHRVYNTFTDASNGEWLDVAWVSGVCNVRTNQNGTGSSRSLSFGTTGSGTLAFNCGGTDRWYVIGSGHLWAAADNAYDVGAGGFAPRSVYAGTSLELQSLAWVRGDPGRKRLTADVTNATTTLANLADLSVTLVAGRKYAGRLVLKVSNSTATGGVKLDFGGGTATMTSFWAVATPAGTAGSGGAIVTGTMVSTTLTGAVNYTTITGETLVVVEFSLVALAGGTFIPRVATNTAGTVTARLGSTLDLWDSPN
jgi:hypothetical protein